VWIARLCDVPRDSETRTFLHEIPLLRGPVAREMAANYPDFAKRVWGLTT
jgi:hypothetical protein